MTKEKIIKSLDTKLQQVTYVALQPGVDLHGDLIEVDEIRKAKESFNKSKTVKPNLFHLVNTSAFDVIESYQIPCDVTLSGHFVAKGSWLQTLQIHSKELWDMIEKDEINGISIGALAEWEPVDAD